MILKNVMSEFFHNLSMQALSKSDDTIIIKFYAINRLNKSLNDLLMAESLAFNTKKISRMTTEFFDQPIFVAGEQTDNKKIEENIVKNILNDKKMEFPTDTYHISLPNIAEEIKQQRIDENKLFIETQLKKNERDVEPLENLINDLIKTLTDPSDGMILDDVINVNDWVNKTDNKKLDQDVQQNYNEIAGEVIRANNADLLSEMVTNNEIKDSIILEKIIAQKEYRGKQLAEKIQPDLDVYLLDDDVDDESVELIEIDNSSLKRRRSKCLAELNRKTKHETTVKKRSKPYLRNKKSFK